MIYRAIISHLSRDILILLRDQQQQQQQKNKNKKMRHVLYGPSLKNDSGSHCHPRKQRARQPITCDPTSFLFFARKFLIYQAIVGFYCAINDKNKTKQKKSGACPLWAIVKKWALFFVFFCFSSFLLVSRAFSSTPLVYKGRADYTETSWYLAASQAVITSDYQSVITLSTRDFWSQFVWLLPPTGGKATYFVFLFDHAIITGFPGHDHI